MRKTDACARALKIGDPRLQRESAPKAAIIFIDTISIDSQGLDRWITAFFK
jgi:hypothetical protein